MGTTHEAVHERLLAFALGLPEAWQDHPWGDEPVAKVRKKIFVFLGASDRLHVAAKLPESGGFLRNEPWAEPTGYGLGRHGWVSMDFTDVATADIPVDLLEDCIEESYRAIAPKTLSRQLDELRDD